MHQQRPHSTCGSNQLVPGNDFILILPVQCWARISWSSWMPTQSGPKWWKCQQLLLPGTLLSSKCSSPQMDSPNKLFQTMDHSLQPMRLPNSVDKMESGTSEVLRTILQQMEQLSGSAKQKKSLQASSCDGLSLQFPAAVSYYTTCDNSSAPSSLYLGRCLRTRSDLLHRSVEKHVRDHQVSRSWSTTAAGRESSLLVSCIIMAIQKLPSRTKVDATTCPLQDWNTALPGQHGNSWRRYIDHLIRKEGRAREDTALEPEAKDDDIYWPLTSSPTVEERTRPTWSSLSLSEQN